MDTVNMARVEIVCGNMSGECHQKDRTVNRDAIFRVLANEQRRVLLRLLIKEYPSSVPIEAAIAHIASTTNSEDGEILRKLHHFHLPKLVEAGLVNYETDNARLTYAGGKYTEEMLEL